MKVLNAYIYRHIRPDTNQVFYIGIGTYQKKWKHARAYTHKNRNPHWTNIVNACEGTFFVQILMDELTKEEAILKEKEFIKIYGRVDLKTGSLCNLTDGGEGIMGVSLESRKKISESRLGVKNPMYGKKQSSEHVAKRISCMKGENNPNYGKALPQWQKDINRIAQLGRKQSEYTVELRCSKLRRKVINTKTGHIYSSIKDVAFDFNKSACQISRDISKNKYDLKFI